MGSLLQNTTKLTGIFDQGKAPSLHFGQEGCAAIGAFDIAYLPSDNAAFKSGLRVEQVSPPALR